MRTVLIEDITVGERHRREMGNLRDLADSIERLGVLQPIGITIDHQLVFGHRRLEALKLLGKLADGRVLRQIVPFQN